MANEKRKNRGELIDEFSDGKRPAGCHFEELIHSFPNYEEDITGPNAQAFEFPKGLKIGDATTQNPQYGEIRWFGNEFRVYKEGNWKPFGGAKWEDGENNNIYYNDGSVGIGTMDINPISKLHINGSLTIENGGLKLSTNQEVIGIPIMMHMNLDVSSKFSSPPPDGSNLGIKVKGFGSFMHPIDKIETIIKGWRAPGFIAIKDCCLESNLADSEEGKFEVEIDFSGKIIENYDNEDTIVFHVLCIGYSKVTYALNS